MNQPRSISRWFQIQIWYQSFDGVFFLSVGTVLVTGISVCLGYCLKSKCTSVKFCGIEVIRDVELEADIEELGIQNQTNTIQPIIQSLLPTNNSLVSNKDNIIRRSSIKNSRTLQEIIDTVKDLKTTESIKNVIDNVIDNVENNTEYKL